MGRLFVAGRNGAPLLQPVPHPLDPLPVYIDPIRAAHWSFVAPGRDGRSGAQLPYGRPHHVRRVAAIRHDPARDAGQKGQEIEGLWRLARLPGGQGETQSAATGVSNDMGLGAEATLASAKRLMVGTRCVRFVIPLFVAPADFW